METPIQSRCVFEIILNLLTIFSISKHSLFCHPRKPLVETKIFYLFFWRLVERLRIRTWTSGYVYKSLVYVCKNGSLLCTHSPYALLRWQACSRPPTGRKLASHMLEMKRCPCIGRLFRTKENFLKLPVVFPNCLLNKKYVYLHWKVCVWCVSLPSTTFAEFSVTHSWCLGIAELWILQRYSTK